MNNKTFVIIPVFNEEKVIRSVLKSIKKQGFKSIIVIDDGSTDNTFSAASKEKVYILRHIINRGKGAAVVTGINAAMKLNANYVVTIDGDGQNESRDLINIEKNLRKNFDVVLGYRNLLRDKAPFIRIITNYIANIFISFLYGIKVKDSQSGLRGYSKKAISLMDISSERYEFDSYVIRELARQKIRYKEVPIKIYYTDYSKSKKNKQNFINGIKTVYKIIMSL